MIIIIIIIISSPHPDTQWEELPSMRQRERPCGDYLLYHKDSHRLAVLVYMMTTIEERTVLTTELHDQLRFISLDIQSFHVCLDDLLKKKKMMIMMMMMMMMDVWMRDVQFDLN
jgi:hypothetical protein